MATVHTLRMDSIQMNPHYFNLYRTDTILDKLLSSYEGLPVGVNYMVIGDPGVGKTTIMLDLIANLKNKNRDLKALFISVEMNEIDLWIYVNRYPKFGSIDILFIEKDIENKIKYYDIVKEVLDEGWDVVVIDSFTELQEVIKEELNINNKLSETFLLSLIKKQNKGLNQSNVNTTFLSIQQVTKSGEFLGTNRLKHAITGMMELRLENKKNIHSDRYIMFSKHRRGNVGVRLYYDLSKNNDVMYDEARFAMDSKLNEHRNSLAKQMRDFNQNL